MCYAKAENVGLEKLQWGEHEHLFIEFSGRAYSIVGSLVFPLSVTYIAHTTIEMEEILTSVDEMLEGIGEKHHTVRLLMNLHINTGLSLERQ